MVLERATCSFEACFTAAYFMLPQCVFSLYCFFFFVLCLCYTLLYYYLFMFYLCFTLLYYCLFVLYVLPVLFCTSAVYSMFLSLPPFTMSSLLSSAESIFHAISSPVAFSTLLASIPSSFVFLDYFNVFSFSPFDFCTILGFCTYIYILCSILTPSVFYFSSSLSFHSSSCF